jgi:hypothetical protein
MEFAQAGSVTDADESDGQARKSRVQALFRGNIERAGCLVEDCKAWSTQESPREGQPLLLAARQIRVSSDCGSSFDPIFRSSARLKMSQNLSLTQSA